MTGQFIVESHSCLREMRLSRGCVSFGYLDDFGRVMLCETISSLAILVQYVSSETLRAIQLASWFIRAQRTDSYCFEDVDMLHRPDEDLTILLQTFLDDVVATGGPGANRFHLQLHLHF